MQENRGSLEQKLIFRQHLAHSCFFYTYHLNSNVMILIAYGSTFSVS